MSSTDVSEQAAAAQALIYRVLPEHAANVTIMVDPSIGPKLKDTFTVGSHSVSIASVGLFESLLT